MKNELVGFGKILKFMTLAAIPLLACGCATPALVKHTSARNWVPEAEPDQFLATTITGRPMVLVVFHQTSYTTSNSKERLVAWNPEDSPDKVIVGPNALRHFTNACYQVQAMPVFYPDEIPADATSMAPGYVALDRQRSNFTIFHEGVPPEPFNLPASHEPCRAFARVAGMPFAVAADAALVGAVVGIGFLGASGNISVSP
jgi:hypothetical protein